MKREIIKIDDEKCTGCGLCVPNCHEGALQIIDGKARLVSELMCDGLGACIGHCPEDAITIEKREAEPYNETETLKQMIPKGKNLVKAHLQHLKEHNESELLAEGLDYLSKRRDTLPFSLDALTGELEMNEKGEKDMKPKEGACPGAMAMAFNKTSTKQEKEPVSTDQGSELTHWPVQLHLINPAAGYFKETDLVLAADCVAFAAGDFHAKYLAGKTLAIACPKLDTGKDIYMAKIKDMIDKAGINTLTVMMMEVPCCSGLLQLAKEAAGQAKRKVPVKAIIISIKGEKLKEEWV